MNTAVAQVERRKMQRTDDAIPVDQTFRQRGVGMRTPFSHGKKVMTDSGYDEVANAIQSDLSQFTLSQWGEFPQQMRRRACWQILIPSDGLWGGF